jgi:regulator of protease activity HflC (stomatin/prohibitin superfamily)
MALIGLLRALAGFSWLAVIGVIGLLVARAARNNPMRGGWTMVLGTLIAAVLVNTLSLGLVFIEPNERGVVVSAVPGAQGVRQEALQPGLNWIVPFFDRVVTYSISRQTYTMSISPEEGAIRGDDSVEARTADGQVVYVDASIIFAINPAKVVDLHIDWQNTYVDGLVRTLTRGVIRNAVSTFGIEEVYSVERLTLTNNIRNELETKLANEGLILVDFVLRNIAFSDEYAASVEAKQVAEQLAQQAAFVVEQRRQEAEQARQVAQGSADAAVIAAQGRANALIIEAKAEAEARIIQAEAEAEALRLLGQALAEYPQVLQLQYIEKLSPNITVMLLPNDSPFIIPLPDLSTP